MSDEKHDDVSDASDGSGTGREESAFEYDLRHRLGALAALAPSAPTRTNTTRQHDHAVRPGIGRRLAEQRWMVAAAAAVIVLLGGILIRQSPEPSESATVVAVDDSDDSSAADDLDIDAAPPDGGIWIPMAPAPSGFTERAYAATGWTGSDVVFWAGSSADRNFAYADGAAYNPIADSWSSLPTPGWGHPGLSSAYFEGSIYATAKGGGSRLDFGAERWTDMAPVSGILLAATVATADGIYGLGPRSNVSEGSLDIGIAQYFPPTDTWGEPTFHQSNRLDTDTYRQLLEHPPFWSGSEIVVANAADENLAFNPETETWRVLPTLNSRTNLPDSGPPETSVTKLTAVDGKLLAVAADSTSQGAVVGQLIDEMWHWSDGVLPIAVNDNLTVASAGDWLLLISQRDDPIAYHVASGQWFQHEDGPKVEAPNTVWTGDRLVVWGGGSAPDRGRVTNLIWSPSPTDETEPTDVAADEPTAACDAELAAQQLGAGLPELDVDPSTGPVDLQGRSRAVLRGTILMADPEVSDRIEGTRLLVKADIRWIGEPQGTYINDLWIPSLDVTGFSSQFDPETAVDFVAFVERQLPNGAWVVHPEGFWVSCGFGDPALPVLVDEFGGQWKALADSEASLSDIWNKLDWSTFEVEPGETIESSVASFDAGPLTARVGHGMVWTGTEMVVWGGWSDESGAVAFDDGAAYDPATDTWRPLSPGPLSARRDPTVAWTGDKLLIFNGRTSGNKTASGGASYDPSSDTWQSFDTTPFDDSAGDGLTSVWTSDGLVVWDPGGDKVARFDPGAVRWQPMPATGLEAATGTLRWSGADQATLFAVAVADPGRNSTLLVRSLPSGAEAWETVPGVSLRTPSNADGANPALSGWVDDRLVVWSRNGRDSPTMMYRPPSGEWEEAATIPLPPRDRYGTALEIGDRLAVFSSDGRLFTVYDPAWDRWRTAPTFTDTPSDKIIWTGSEIIMWDAPTGSVQAIRVLLD